MPRGQYDRTKSKEVTATGTDLAGMLRQIDIVDRKIEAAKAAIDQLLADRSQLRKGIDVELARRDKAFGQMTSKSAVETAEAPADNAWTAARFRNLMNKTGLDARAIADRCETDPSVIASWTQGNGPFYPLKNSLAILDEIERLAS